MANRVFLDTNIVLDIIDKNRNSHNISTKLWEYLIVNEYDICISEDMITTIYYISKDKNITLEFLKIVYKRWQIETFGLSLLRKATDIALQKDIDLEDILQCLLAKELKCEAFITNDKDFCDCGIRITTSKEFLAL